MFVKKIMENKKMPEISVVVPCFNEEKTIYSNIKKINNYLSNYFREFEIIAVNDGSQDNTDKELQRAKLDFSKVVIIENALNTGKGKAVKDGMLKSRYEVVMFLDADLAIPIEETNKFVAEIENGYSLVIASRFVPGLKVIRPILWYRKYMEKIFRLIRMLIINNYNIHDTQCGFKVFSRRAAQDIFPLMTVERFAFDAEIVFIAEKFGYKIKELPVILQNPAASSVRIYRDSVNMLIDLVKIRINDFLGKYKKPKKIKS